MDKKGDEKGRWAWLPLQMPGVARLMAEKKALFGVEHVSACWKHGVIDKQPGWLFAREGSLSVGTPPDNDPEVLQLAFSAMFATQAFLYIREPGAADGQN